MITSEILQLVKEIASDCLLDYFKKHYKIKAKYLGKQQVIDVDPKVIQQIISQEI